MSYHKLNSPKQKSFFTKRHSVFFKGLAIILLVLHHLFGCRTFLVDPDIKWVGIPFFNIIGSNEARGAAAPLFGKFKESGGMSLLGFELGDFGKLGLSLFIFISGYGIFCAISRYRTVKEMYRAVAVRLKNFLVRWWVILALIAVPVAICLKKFSFKLLLVNILPVICDFKTLFIGFSWYVWVYVMFLLAAPAFIKLMSKNLWQNLAAFVLLPYVFSVVIDKLGGVSFADVNTRSLFSV
ncbi:MAG: acyltransferase family protein, partial [Clostridia bacterium]|nr:acyltransferase family protein [Clostridia bacterium]